MGGGVGGLLYSKRWNGTGWTMSFDLANGRGDVTTQTNASGNVTWQASYEAFGMRTAEAGTNNDHQRANSKEEDPSGLLNEGFRYRDLEAGVFISRDPAGFVDGPNVYCYVVQNPWTTWDSLGLEDARSSGSLGTATLTHPTEAAELYAEFYGAVASSSGAASTTSAAGTVVDAAVTVVPAAVKTQSIIAAAAALGNGGSIVATGNGAGGDLNNGFPLPPAPILSGDGKSMSDPAITAAIEVAKVKRLLRHEEDRITFMEVEDRAPPEPSTNGAGARHGDGWKPPISDYYDIGKACEVKTHEELIRENPGKEVFRERYLRNANGDRLIDKATGEGRRVDHAVFDSKTMTATIYETTGLNTIKKDQIQKENSIFKDNKDVYVRNPRDRKMYKVEKPSAIRRQK